MRISFAATCKQVVARPPPAAPSPVMNFPGRINMDAFLPWSQKEKVVIVIGATGTGKSRLSIDLASQFPAEIVNSDKMQVYKGLDIATNKVTEEECRGVPHHLLGFVDPKVEFTAKDFQHHASLAVESIMMNNRLPIIAGGSNSYIKALVHNNIEFQSKYHCCFLWVDVSLPVLHSFVSERVDRMVQAGLVDEIRRFFNPNMVNHSKGLWRAIGVPELDQFFRNEDVAMDIVTRNRLLQEAIGKIKDNTCKLATRQFQNILTLQNQLEWDMHHLDATEAFLKQGFEADEAWERLVVRPSTLIVHNFLYGEEEERTNFLTTMTPSSVIVAASMINTTSTTTTAAIATATH